MKKTILSIIIGMVLIGCNPVRHESVGPYLSQPAPQQITDFATEINTASIVSTPMITPSWATQSAFDKLTSEERVIELLQDNGGCQLPCFWGFIPWNADEGKIQSFYNMGGHVTKISRDNSIIEISTIMNSSKMSQSQWLHVNLKVFRQINSLNGSYKEPVFDNPHFQPLIRYYTLQNLLSLYGPPSQAYIGIDLGEEMGFENLMNLYLDYPEAGWSVQFVMPLLKEKRTYIGCPDQAFTYLELRAPENEARASENLREFLDHNLNLPIEEATSNTLDEFYNQFKDPAVTRCVITPIEKWR